jgi:hypothetical protein
LTGRLRGAVIDEDAAAPTTKSPECRDAAAWSLKEGIVGRITETRICTTRRGGRPLHCNPRLQETLTDAQPDAVLDHR